MRLSAWFGRTQRQVPDLPVEHGLYPLVRAGYAVYKAGGEGLLLPLGVRLLERVLAAWQAVFPDGLSLDFPQGSAVLWRVPAFPAGPALDDLPPIWADWLGRHILSYRDLPRRLWGREPSGWWALALGHEDPWEALAAFWRALGLALLPVTAAEDGTAWVWLHPQGDAEVLTCTACDYRALQPWAARQRPKPPEEPLQPLEAVSTPGANTIQALADFLHIGAERTAKAVFLTDTASGDLIFAVVRGDMEVSLPKVQAVLGCGPLRPATPEEIRAVGAEPGYASPVGVEGARVIVDSLIPRTPNLVAGANRPDTHYRGVNYGRDFLAQAVADLVPAQEGDPCPCCGAPLAAQRAVFVAQAAPPRPDAEMTYRTQEGKPAPLVWAPFRLSLWGLLTALGGTHRDEQGLRWPASLAPFAVHLIALRGGEEVANQLYAALRAAGVSVLFDDRRESPGVKFTDADLLGLPWRVTASKRSLAQGGVEVRRRADGATQILTPHAALAYLREQG